jgi:8-oxo-dGTP pyrophosphatase MutT (NUDIX family)
MVKAAVLLPIYKKNILFIKRNRYLKKHPGEISFPGGKFDHNKDKTFIDTAIRETEEEIGIDRSNIKIIAKLPVERTVSTNFLVYSYVAKINSNNFNINFNEVEKVILIPIKHLNNDKFKQVVPLKINGEIFYNTFYYYKNYLIWGATSRILDNFFRNIKLKW